MLFILRLRHTHTRHADLRSRHDDDEGYWGEANLNFFPHDSATFNSRCRITIHDTSLGVGRMHFLLLAVFCRYEGARTRTADTGPWGKKIKANNCNDLS